MSIRGAEVSLVLYTDVVEVQTHGFPSSARRVLGSRIHQRISLRNVARALSLSVDTKSRFVHLARQGERKAALAILDDAPEIPSPWLRELEKATADVCTGGLLLRDVRLRHQSAEELVRRCTLQADSAAIALALSCSVYRSSTVPLATKVVFVSINEHPTAPLQQRDYDIRTDKIWCMVYAPKELISVSAGNRLARIMGRAIRIDHRCKLGRRSKFMLFYVGGPQKESRRPQPLVLSLLSCGGDLGKAPTPYQITLWTNRAVKECMSVLGGHGFSSGFADEDKQGHPEDRAHDSVFAPPGKSFFFLFSWDEDVHERTLALMGFLDARLYGSSLLKPLLGFRISPVVEKD